MKVPRPDEKFACIFLSATIKNDIYSKADGLVYYVRGVILQDPKPVILNVIQLTELKIVITACLGHEVQNNITVHHFRDLEFGI